MALTLGQNNVPTEGTQSLINKVKRLSIALYRLTDYFDTDEPMRASIRARTIVLMDSAIALKDIKRPINELLSYTDVLLYSGLLSETNIRILKDELMSLMNQVETLNVGEASPFFGIGDLMLDEPKLQKSQVSGFIRQDTAFLQTEPDSQKDKRQSAIIDFIKKNGGANVRDLMAVVKGCSEKTIQRELALLIARGTLKREGERRWSKYLLARSS